VPAQVVTIRAGGPFDGVLTITAIPEGHGRGLVEAQWRRDGEPRTALRMIDGYTTARALAHTWAGQLAAGREPTPPSKHRERTVRRLV
jgi:hypothetical protein